MMDAPEEASAFSEVKRLYSPGGRAVLYILSQACDIWKWTDSSEATNSFSKPKWPAVTLQCKEAESCIHAAYAISLCDERGKKWSRSTVDQQQKASRGPKLISASNQHLRSGFPRFIKGESGDRSLTEPNQHPWAWRCLSFKFNSVLTKMCLCDETSYGMKSLLDSDCRSALKWKISLPLIFYLSFISSKANHWTPLTQQHVVNTSIYLLSSSQ